MLWIVYTEGLFVLRLEDRLIVVVEVRTQVNASTAVLDQHRIVFILEMTDANRIIPLELH